MFYFWLPSSSCRAISTDIPVSLLPHLPIVHCFRQILRVTSCIGTELLYVGSSWMSCVCSSMKKGCYTNSKDHGISDLQVRVGKERWLHFFSKSLAQRENQRVSCKIWTRIARHVPAMVITLMEYARANIDMES